MLYYIHQTHLSSCSVEGGSGNETSMHSCTHAHTHSTHSSSCQQVLYPHEAGMADLPSLLAYQREQDRHHLVHMLHTHHPYHHTQHLCTGGTHWSHYLCVCVCVGGGGRGACVHACVRVRACVFHSPPTHPSHSPIHTHTHLVRHKVSKPVQCKHTHHSNGSIHQPLLVL